MQDSRPYVEQCIRSVRLHLAFLFGLSEASERQDQHGRGRESTANTAWNSQSQIVSSSPFPDSLSRDVAQPLFCPKGERCIGITHVPLGALGARHAGRVRTSFLG